MEHKGTKRLKTERLILRPFEETDAENMFRNWACDPEVTKFLTWPAHESAEVTKKVLRGWIDDYSRADNYQWAIELKEIGEPIGSISAVKLDEETGSVTVGYCIGRSWWRQGITAEALRAVISFSLRRLG